VAEGPVTSLAKFGAFIDLGDGIEGMVHIGDISREKRLNHPNEALKMGERVRAQVLEADRERRRLRLGIKQLEPTSIDEYIAEHKAGDQVSGRVVDVSAGSAAIELGEGIRCTCRIGSSAAAAPETKTQARADLSSLSSMLTARWKGNAPAASGKPEPLNAGQIRSFKIVKLDADAKKIEVELA
ncbi:MAG: S1 RNA-binding domain-containing protein, partial [Acidobacteriota bacterium]|nr:S1 RNA-binding domain-containing protein [Acidobacteriota bacterium]